MKLLFLLLAQASALQLTPDNWDSSVAGKTVFLKFFAPWCGHCKKMKPAWDELSETYLESDVVIAEVDCTSDKELCDEAGVKGFPTLKYGDADNLEAYEGGRDYASLSSFVETLRPPCNVYTMEHCSVEEKVLVDDLSRAPLEYVSNLLKMEEQERQEIESSFEEALESLKSEYQTLFKKKEEDLNALKKAYNVGIIKKMLHKGKDEL